MMATTMTRKATETMMPSSVKNDRSLLSQIACIAKRIASESGMNPGAVLELADGLIAPGDDLVALSQAVEHFEVVFSRDADANGPEECKAAPYHEHSLGLAVRPAPGRARVDVRG